MSLASLIRFCTKVRFHNAFYCYSFILCGIITALKSLSSMSFALLLFFCIISFDIRFHNSFSASLSRTFSPLSTLLIITTRSLVSETSVYFLWFSVFCTTKICCLIAFINFKNCVCSNIAGLYVSNRASKAFFILNRLEINLSSAKKESSNPKNNNKYSL